MVPDLQSSMKELREANADTVALLTHLKQFLAGAGPITITVGGTSYTSPSIPDLIQQYRDGTFSSVTIEADGRKAVLSFHDGALQIVDGNGDPMLLEVAKVRYGSIESCTLGDVVAEGCHIGELDAGSIAASKADVESVAVRSLTAGAISVQALGTGDLNADTASFSELHVGRTVFQPRDTLDLFKAGGTVYNHSASDTAFVRAGAYSNWKCSRPYPSGYKAPETMGFQHLPGDAEGWVLTAPDMMAFNGDTAPGNYIGGLMSQIVNFYVMGVGPHGTQALMSSVQVATQSGAIGDSSTGITFATALGWPIRSYVPDTSTSTRFPSNDNGIGIVHEISASDIGHIVYIRTGAQPWPIPRVLEVKYLAGIPVASALGTMYTVPPYSCLRVRLSRYAVDGDGFTLYRNVLELT